MSLPRSPVLLALTLVACSIAPAPLQSPPKPSPLAEARFKAAARTIRGGLDLLPAVPHRFLSTYYWSRIVLEAQQDLSNAKVDQIAALERTVSG